MLVVLVVLAGTIGGPARGAEVTTTRQGCSGPSAVDGGGGGHRGGGRGDRRLGGLVADTDGPGSCVVRRSAGRSAGADRCRRCRTGGAVGRGRRHRVGRSDRVCVGMGCVGIGCVGTLGRRPSSVAVPVGSAADDAVARDALELPDDGVDDRAGDRIGHRFDQASWSGVTATSFGSAVPTRCGISSIAATRAAGTRADRIGDTGAVSGEVGAGTTRVRAAVTETAAAGAGVAVGARCRCRRKGHRGLRLFRSRGRGAGGPTRDRVEEGRGGHAACLPVSGGSGRPGRSDWARASGTRTIQPLIFRMCNSAFWISRARPPASGRRAAAPA